MDDADGDLIDTPHGPARVHRIAAGGARRGALLLGHGAGGSVTAPDLQAVVAAVAPTGIEVVLVEQPYRVAGRKSAAPAKQLDVAWTAVVDALELAGTPFVVGGRSSGARVACRTAQATGAAGILCLAFPLITPKGARRQDELDHAGVPTLIVQGTSDRFGMPEPDDARKREVVRVAGDHGLKKDHDTVAGAAVRWLDDLLPS